MGDTGLAETPAALTSRLAERGETDLHGMEKLSKKGSELSELTLGARMGGRGGCRRARVRVLGELTAWKLAGLSDPLTERRLC